MVNVQTRVEPQGATLVARVSITPRAAVTLRRLRSRHGAVTVVQSSAGEAPLCRPRSDHAVAPGQMLLGLLYDDVPEPSQTEAVAVAGENPDLLTRRSINAVVTGESTLNIPEHLTPVWVRRADYETRTTTQLLLDVAPEPTSAHSLEQAEGVRFVFRERTFDERGQVWLETCRR